MDTYRLHAHDGFLHLGDICDMVLIGFELLLLDPLIDAHHQFSGDIRAIIHTYQRGGRGRSEPQTRGARLPSSLNSEVLVRWL